MLDESVALFGLGSIICFGILVAFDVTRVEFFTFAQTEGEKDAHYIPAYGYSWRHRRR